MIFERIKTAGTAHNSYFVAAGGVAVVIDPRRDVDIYLELSRRHESNIKYILETHRNEDFVIGSVELAAVLPEAEIWHGPGLDWKYGRNLAAGQEFRPGRIRLRAVFTPGHTDEGVSYVLTDTGSGDAPVMVFTGDTLFVGDTGRIDLYGPDEAPRLANRLYDSIFQQLLPLGDGVIICPGHGAGSVCGSHIAAREESTLGTERRQNPALQYRENADFVRHKLAEKMERPHYFRKMEVYNLEGPPVLGSLPQPPPLSPAAFQQHMENGAVVVDTRLPVSYGGLHIKGSYNIWLEGLSVFAGWTLSYDRPLLLVTDEAARVEDAVRNLIRSGYDNIAGYLRGGIEAWHNAGKECENTPQLTVHGLKDKMARREPLVLLDVRDDEEWQAGHIEGARHIYVGHLAERLAELDKNQPVVVYCTVGHRAGLAASILQRAGFSDVSSIPGSFAAWRSAGFPVVAGE